MKNTFTRLVSAFLCLCLLLGFAACKKEDNKKDNDKNDTSAGQQGGDNMIPDIFDKDDKVTPPADDTPEDPQTPVVPPAPEVVRSTAYDTRVTSDEIILHNGIKIGMSYDEVAAYSGYEGAKPEGNDSIYFVWDNITYSFVADTEKGFKLNYINIAEEAANAGIFRDIKIGDSLDSVFGKIPAKDTELKKWAVQFLYGYEDTDPKGYADLRFIALSYYTVNVFTPEYVVNITFSREAMTVKWVEISAR